jgi:hypothetical protein
MKNHILYLTWGDITLSKNKSFEYQFEFGKNTSSNSPFELSFVVTEKRDHAGPCFTFGIKNLFWVCLKIYDHRHWDDENNCWKNLSQNTKT